jgi:hypothetical protein
MNRKQHLHKSAEELRIQTFVFQKNIDAHTQFSVSKPAHCLPANHQDEKKLKFLFFFGQIQGSIYRISAFWEEWLLVKDSSGSFLRFSLLTPKMRRALFFGGHLACRCIGLL